MKLLETLVNAHNTHESYQELAQTLSEVLRIQKSESGAVEWIELGFLKSCLRIYPDRIELIGRVITDSETIELKDGRSVALEDMRRVVQLFFRGEA